MASTKGEQFVIDSSIVAKWFLTEPDSDKAIELRDSFATGRMRFVVPTLIFYEVINALRFSQRFSKNDLATAARSLSKYRFEIWRPRGKLLELMAHLSLEDDLTVYDACYIALAKRMGLKLITEDAELLTKFPGLTRAL